MAAGNATAWWVGVVMVGGGRISGVLLCKIGAGVRVGNRVTAGRRTMEASSAGVQEKLTKHRQSMNECAGLKIGTRLALERSNSPLTKLGEQL